MPDAARDAEQVVKRATQRCSEFFKSPEGWNDTSQGLWTFLKAEIATTLTNTRNATLDEAARIAEIFTTDVTGVQKAHATRIVDAIRQAKEGK